MKFQQLAVVFGAISGAWSLAVPQNANGLSRREITAFGSISASGMAGSLVKRAEKLDKRGLQSGINSEQPNGAVWKGAGGYYTLTVSNKNDKSMTFVLWAPQPGSDPYSVSFVASPNAPKPLITASIASGASIELSIADGVSGGAFSAFSSDDALSTGQIANTWGEFTTAGVYSTINVSREPNMSGNRLEIYGMKNGCIANMDHCAFQCISGNTCWQSGSYKLVNCANQSGGQEGVYAGNPSGGCLMGPSNSKIYADFY